MAHKGDRYWAILNRQEDAYLVDEWDDIIKFKTKEEAENWLDENWLPDPENLEVVSYRDF